MEIGRITFSGHALQRMFERSISRAEVHEVMTRGEVIADYPDDKPLPSRLLVGFPGGRAVHVVVAAEDRSEHVIVVTVYEPDPGLWDDGYRRRKTS